MKILIDADGCPVVNQAVGIAKKYKIECIIICDTAHVFDREGAKTVVVEKGADSVDFKLVNMLQEGDVAITQDYGLAAMALAKEAIPLSQNGLIYNNSNIDELLFSRYVSKKIRQSGGRLKGPSKRSHEQDERFEQTLTKILESFKSEKQ